MSLLQRWQTIHDEAVQLADIVQQLPETCACGDAEAHLQGRCLDDHRRGQSGTHPDAAGNCSDALARLHSDLFLFNHDVSVMLSLCDRRLWPSQRLELTRGLFVTASDVLQVINTFHQLSAAVVRLHHHWTAGEMQCLKRHAAELRDRCERLNAELFGTALQ